MMKTVEYAVIGQLATDKQLGNFFIRYGKVTKKENEKVLNHISKNLRCREICPAKG